MTKILIINLKKFGDIFQTSHLIASIKKKTPSAEVSLLCYGESYSAAKILKGLTTVHTIDRKKIISFFKNSIYSDGLAFNQIEKSLRTVLDTKFDKVINYSNDKTSSYLTSYLCSNPETKFEGIRFTEKQSISYSNEYSVIFNDVITSTPYTPYSFNDCQHLISDLSPAKADGVKSNKLHDQTALNNLNRLRKMKNEDISTTSIIGIQLLSGDESKDIPKEVLVRTIELIQASKEMIPILLIGPFPKERALANELNATFDSKLVSVEADFIALPSVLKSIDLVVTADTSIKHLCDIQDTACVEVSLGGAPLFKQGSNNTQSAIISAPAHMRNFKGSLGIGTKSDEYDINPNLVFHTARLLLGLSTEGFNFEDEKSIHCVYRPTKVLDGVVLMPISGPFNDAFEIRRLLCRSIVQKTLKGVLDENYITLIANRFEKAKVTKVINEEKEALSGVTKELLSTLRGLIQTQENNSKAPLFIAALEKLLSKCFDNSLSAIPAMMFRAKIESLNSNSMQENFKEVEGLLYELKDNLQHSIFTYSTIERVSQEAYTNKRKATSLDKQMDERV